MFKFSALSQIWKKYILKLNAGDLSLNKDNYYIILFRRQRRSPGGNHHQIAVKVKVFQKEIKLQG